jgi:hypothetical protein
MSIDDLVRATKFGGNPRKTPSDAEGFSHPKRLREVLCLQEKG